MGSLGMAIKLAQKGIQAQKSSGADAAAAAAASSAKAAVLRPVVLCGPSGVGKSTLIGRLLAESPTRYGFSVS